MPHLHGAVLDCIQHARSGDDFAGGKHLDRELATGGGGHALGNDFRGAVDGVKALREAGRQAPLDFRRLCQCLARQGERAGAG